MRGLKFVALILGIGLTWAAAGADLWTPAPTAHYLRVDQAFKVIGAEKRHDGIHVVWEIAPGYYLYRERLGAQTEDGRGVKLTLPVAENHVDPTLGSTGIYRLQLNALVKPLPSAPEPLHLVLHFQGCADAGLCYPPQQVDVAVTQTAH